MTRSPALPTLLACLAAAGCGSESYQARTTDNAIPFFRHQDELNAAVDARAGRGELTIRPPRGFKLVPPPPKKPGAETGRDPRLPPGFEGDLPGLVEAFQGEMRAYPDSQGGAARPVPVYAYLISSRALPKKEGPTPKFDDTVFIAIAKALGLPETPTFGRDQTFGGQGFAPTVRLTPAIFETTVDGVPMRYRLYVGNVSGLPVAVLFVVPRDADRSERLDEKIGLSLETVQVRAPSAAPGPAGGPAGGSGGPGF